MKYKDEDFLPYYKDLKRHALNSTALKKSGSNYQYRHELAEDIVQNIFIKFSKYKDNIKVPLKNYLHKLVKWESFIPYKEGYGVKYQSKGICTDYFYTETINNKGEVIELYPDYSVNNTDSYVNLKDLYKVINALKSNKEKEAVLYSYEGYTLAEMSKKMNVTIKSVEYYLYNGRKKIKSMMKD